MKIKKAACIPLVLHDPFFSVWSNTDNLYDDNPIHWCGEQLPMKGWLTIDGQDYAFLGQRFGMKELPQVSVSITATATEYIFENDKVWLKCRFTSPILLDDMLLVSRPCTYVDFEIQKKNAEKVELHYNLHAAMVRQGLDEVIGYTGVRKDFRYSYMGRVVQQPLSGSDDGVKIDWGYVYLASQDKTAEIWYDNDNENLLFYSDMTEDNQTEFILAYDDLLSIHYFGQWRKAYWTRTYETILDAIGGAYADKTETLQKATKFDKEIEEKAYAIGGEDYVFLCNMSYRQAVAGHKLITDEAGNILFLSKENDSNGCIGTVDVSYPSIPLFMMYDTEYVKGMLRPIFKFATYDVWEFDFAPHDVGRYPYAWGQAYAYKGNFGPNATEKRIWKPQKGGVFPPFYMYPAGSGVYDSDYQMPVEECGNMLVMTAAVCRKDGNADFAKPYWDTLKQWKNYLVEFGSDPGSQLCTDDFAGHLAHNVNLSVKAIMGIEGYAMLAEMLGEKEEADKYHALAKEMAMDWEERADAGDHYALTFGKEDTWSLKYNLVWDKIWNSGLFSKEVYEKELSYYVEKSLKYGTPLDSRSNMAKSDWLLWVATMAESKKQAEKLIAPVARYLEETTTRIPFGDWYMADAGTYCMFKARTVQGGIFMPMFYEYNK